MTNLAERKSSPNCGELFPWQLKQYRVKIGRTSFSKTGFLSAADAGAALDAKAQRTQRNARHDRDLSMDMKSTL
ncbi:MAG: hypothetical protein ACE5KM_14730 [Planctomycetaceae bacterium]